MKIGLYGGTFDPIHHGHLILAREALEQLKLEKVIFIPAHISPFKTSSPPTSAKMRIRLLEAALQSEPAFEWDSCELEREGPSYTIDTIRQMQMRYPDAEFYYLVGEDQLDGLSNWKNYEELLQFVHFIVLSRGHTHPATSFPTIKRQIDISATDIRNRITQGRSIRYLVPEAVREILLHPNT